MRLEKLLLIFVLLSIPACSIAEQEINAPPYHCRITLTDGSELLGEITDDDSSKVYFKTLSGLDMEIQRSQIEKITPLKGAIVEGKFRRIDPNRSRLLFSATARPLEAGKGYFAVYELFFATLAMGIGDVVSLAGGITLFPGPFQVYHFSPKVTFLNADNICLAAGVMHMGITGFDEGDGFGILYGVSTFGSETAGVTVGFGWAYSGEEAVNKPTVMVGGEVQLSNSFKLISENWFPPGAESVLSMFGMRFFGDKLAADLGFIFLTEMNEGWPFFPWVGFVYNFGR